MSQPFLQQQPPQVNVPLTQQQPAVSHGGWGSVGPVVGVLAVVMVLGVIAGLIGRLCAGRRVLGYGQYDVEGWMEDKCASCIDGRLDIPRPPPSGGGGGNQGSVPIIIPMSVPQEQPKHQHDHHHHHHHEGQQSAAEEQPPGNNAAEP